jgi:hypothetical protein
LYICKNNLKKNIMAVLLGGIGAARRRTESADASSEIKKVLKLAFPKIKFSVRKRSGGNSVTIEWENGPTVREVQAYTKDFEMGSFDGMTDMYTYDNRNKNIPQVKYLFYNRYMSKKLEEFLRAEITKGWNFDNMKDWEKEAAIEREMRKDFNSTSLPAGLSGFQRKNIGRVKL